MAGELPAGWREVLPAAEAERLRQRLRDGAADAFALYRDMLGGSDGAAEAEAPGLARELARIGLPLSTYSEWYWKIDLHNLLHFLALRLDAHAQYEIRVYAEAIGQLVQRWVPQAWEAFGDYRLHAATLSRQELLAVQALLRGESPDYRALGLSAREQRELCQKLALPAPTPLS